MNGGVRNRLAEAPAAADCGTIVCLGSRVKLQEVDLALVAGVRIAVWLAKSEVGP